MASLLFRRALLSRWHLGGSTSQALQCLRNTVGIDGAVQPQCPEMLSNIICLKHLRMYRGGPDTFVADRPQGAEASYEVPIYNLDKQQVGVYTLPGDIFDTPIRRDILHSVVRWQRARRQQGTHSTKTRAEWRGGGVAHGPKPRSHAHALPKRVRRLGIKCALSAKAFERRLLVVDSLKPSVPKTKLMAGKLSALLEGFPRLSVLMVDSSKTGDDGGEHARLATRNIPNTSYVPAEGLNVYEMLRRDVLLLTAAGADAVVARLRKEIKRL